MEKPQDCIVHFCTTQSVKLRILFETLNPLLVEGNIIFSPTGMRLSTMSSMVYCFLRLDADKIESYHCKEETVLGVNFEHMFSYLKDCNQSDVICFQVTEASLSKPVPEFNIYISNHEEQYIYEYQCKLIHIEEKIWASPPRDIDRIVTMPASSFQRILRCCIKQGDHVQIMADGGGVHGNYIYFVTKGDNVVLRITCGYASSGDKQSANPADPGFEPLSGSTYLDQPCDKRDRYSLKYLSLITKATNMSANVRLYLASDYVLIVSYNVGTLGSIYFCLVGSDEESNIDLESVRGNIEMSGVNQLATGLEGSPMYSALIPLLTLR
eukprot:TRINITY_DN2369_c0_g1_i10.p1 TRINITY_DN2369_c0_g1~~TRINITY_DN2369_c0_g1_i10.p1  ORF type:complete len:325 (+),score=34.83 TRINITY_DN2369_c0_g1_i10:466-1440(+)